MYLKRHGNDYNILIMKSNLKKTQQLKGDPINYLYLIYLKHTLTFSQVLSYDLMLSIREIANGYS